MAGQIKFYYDLMSQPSRALYILFKLNKVPYEDNAVALRKGVHLQPEFKQINPFQKVPCINDNTFKLSESIAILRYLNSKGLISDKWYPSELKARARTDEYLEWQHNNTRLSCAMYFQMKWLRPLMTGKEPNEKQVESMKERMEQALDAIENIWLAENKFIAGNSINVADIFAACEIEQPKMAAYDPCEGRPRLKAWMEAVKEATSPYYGEAHQYVDKIVSTQKSKL